MFGSLCETSGFYYLLHFFDILANMENSAAQASSLRIAQGTWGRLRLFGVLFRPPNSVTKRAMLKESLQGFTGGPREAVGSLWLPFEYEGSKW